MLRVQVVKRGAGSDRDAQGAGDEEGLRLREVRGAQGTEGEGTWGTDSSGGLWVQEVRGAQSPLRHTGQDQASQSRAVSGLTSTVPGGPSWYQCSRTWCRSMVPSGRLSSPSGSWVENRLKFSTCTCRVV